MNTHWILYGVVQYSLYNLLVLSAVARLEEHQTGDRKDASTRLSASIVTVQLCP